MYFITSAVLDYWVKGDFEHSDNIVLEDINDIRLKDMISKVRKVANIVFVLLYSFVFCAKNNEF